MKPLKYYGLTALVFLAVIVTSILVKDVTLIIDLVSAFTCSCLMFLFPGFFFLFSYKRYGTPGSMANFKVLGHVYVGLGFL